MSHQQRHLQCKWETFKRALNNYDKLQWNIEDLTINVTFLDLIITIRRLMAQSPLECKGRHIQGHQDRHKSGKQLARWEALNVAMDKAAKRRLRQAMQGDPAPNQPLSGERMLKMPYFSLA